MNLEVRCCCRPENLLGWLPVPAGTEIRRGTVVRFLLSRQRPVESLEGTVTPSKYAEAYLVLSIHTYANAARTWPAYSSDDTPLETLRRIPGFVEHRPATAER